jgi:hypothetical protein
VTLSAAGQIAIDLDTARGKDGKLNVRHGPLLSQRTRNRQRDRRLDRTHFRSAPTSFYPAETKMSEASGGDQDV